MDSERRRRPRLRDVAAEAGVGVATVERVVNARGNVSPETTRRVLVAARKLGYFRAEPPVRRPTVRIEAILVRPDSAFFARLNGALQAASEGLDRSVALYRTFVDENAPDAIARRIERVVARRERDALIVVAQDHPRIVEALRAAGERSVPVVLLVSEIVEAGAALYVGIDNASAGRTAGFLLRTALAGRRGSVLTLSHSGRYPSHRQRVIGFSQYFADLDDDLSFRRCLITGDDDETTFAATSEALAAIPDLVGIYLAGGGHAGAMRALRLDRPGNTVVSIVHELTATTRALLESGALLFAIDQAPEQQARRALETVERLMGLRPGEPERSPIPFRIVTPENLDHVAG